MKILFSPSELKTGIASEKFIKKENFIFPNLYEKRLQIVTLYNDFILNADEKALCKLFGTKKEKDLLYYRKDIFKSGCVKAILRYAGTAYKALQYRNLDTNSQKFIDESVLIFSNLFGVVSARDEIPDYKLKQGESFLNLEIPLNHQKISSSFKIKEYNSDILYNVNFNKKNKNSDSSMSNQSTVNNLFTSNNKDKETTFEEKEDKKIQYEYHLHDKLRSIICKCCLSKELKIKNDLNEKAMDILDNKLDIVTFIRNMIIIDIINEILFEKKTEYIINFLARPIISLKNNDEEEEFSSFYNKYKEADF